ncbi:sugar ABC transporter ATP-binding protein [Dyadobacter fanqingshengii]|uniref:Sugar ABC transporter ATP-binding protein n=1 Tax=Dyadobacter fanqingshengii TaxID=2906443 RepID=A0A9X1P9M9_9BACT|nr:sugar ABC transporter ATP-binding protein [Dyadobacter fanqingshengii]MCF0040577.1 sugar ABC transporter ATP-binding protein [Dyadobacter fanqingshengii]USJ37685.1 sugar ABC transporter ATP-binding protein [Dyadobacter fanqingshengii]
MRLQLQNISKSFGPVQALQSVSFTLAEGEVHAICGENGAGKSTLMNILSGNLQPDDGEIVIDNNAVQIKNYAHAANLGLAIVYQQLSLFENQDIAENIFVNQFPKFKSGLINYRALYDETEKLLQKLHIAHILSPKTMVSTLSAGQKQMVEIAKALSREPTILILDEPTASISGNDAQTLFKIIRNLRSKGTSVIYISHRMEEIFEIADRVTVLKDGKYVGTKDISNIDKHALINMMVGREIKKINREYVESGEVVLEVEGLCNQKLNNVSFKIHRGEIVALAGLVGAGRTEIGKTIFGAMPKESGRILLKNVELKVKKPADAIRNKIAFVPEDRKALGLFLDMNVAENIGSVGLSADRPVFFDHSQSIAVAETYKQKLRIVAHHVLQKVADLSGGNQQKVVLSKWLSTDPDLLIIDEPTHGIDIGAKFEIHGLLQNLALAGKSILLISSELPEILVISDRVLVVKDGAITKELKSSDTTEEEILKWAM